LAWKSATRPLMALEVIDDNRAT